MRWKYWLLTGALLGAFFTPSPVRSADLDKLQAIFDQSLKALNTGNVDAWIALMDDGVVYFPHNLPFPIVGKDDNNKDVAGHVRRERESHLCTDRPPVSHHR